MNEIGLLERQKRNRGFSSGSIERTREALIELANFIDESSKYEKATSKEEGKARVQIKWKDGVDDFDEARIESSGVSRPENSQVDDMQLELDENEQAKDSTKKEQTERIETVVAEIERLIQIGKLAEYISRKSSGADEQFSKSISGVYNSLEHMEEAINETEDCVVKMSKAIRDIRQKTSAITEESSILLEERKELVERLALVEKLEKRFDTREIEWTAGEGVEVGEELIEVLRKIETKMEESTILLQTSKPIAVTELMRRLSRIQERIYKRLYEWAIGEIKGLNKTYPEPKAILKAVLKELQARPAFYDGSIRTLTETRSETIVRNFIMALVRGGPSGVPRPIEIHASDPVRYVGDMLAWVHQAQAEEEELLEMIMVRGRRRASNTSIEEEEQRVEEVLGSCMDGVCHSLELRVDQTLEETGSITVALQLHQLIAFYTDVIKHSEQSLLSNVLFGLLKKSCDVFQSLYKDYISNEIDNTIPPPVTLDLPDSAHKVLGLVEDLLNLRSLSPKTSTRNRRYLYALTPNEGLSIVKQSTVTDTKGEMGDIPTQFIADELHRFVNYVYDIATSTQSLLSYEKDIFRWNLNYRLQNELAAFTNVSSFIKSQVSKQLEIESSLLSSTIDLLIQKSGLESCLSSIKTSSAEKIEKAKLWTCLKDFDIALSKGRMDLTPTTLSRLHSTVYAQKLSQTSIEYFVELYTKLYHSIAISSNADSHVLLVSDGFSQEYDQAMVESIVPKDVTIHNPTSLKLLL